MILGFIFNDLDPEKQAMLKVRIQKALRLNTYDNKTGILTVSDERAEAIISNSNHYQGLFMNDPSLDKERASYAIPANSIKDPGTDAIYECLFLLGCMGLHNRKTRIRHHLYE